MADANTLSFEDFHVKEVGSLQSGWAAVVHTYFPARPAAVASFTSSRRPLCTS